MKRQKLEIYSNKKLLCAHPQQQLYYGSNAFWLFSAGSWRRLRAVPRNKKHALLCRLPLMERMLRLAPRCAAALPEGGWLISLCGSVFRLTEDGCLCREHTYRKGMNNPLSFARIQGVEGFSDGIAYGEYFGNSGKEPVQLWQRQAGKWQSVYTFPAGSVCHIHGIVPAPEQGCVYVLTGDTDSESAIWEFRDGFASCKKLIGGSQRCRSCVAFPWDGDLIYATDTPLEDNGIYRLNPATGESRKLADLPGPVIYGTRRKDLLIFATSVEPDSRIKGRRYLLSYKRGAGVKSFNSYVYIGNPDKGFAPVATGCKDIFPMGLCQFGNFQFPPVEGDELLAVGQSLVKYHGKTVKLEYE